MLKERDSKSRQIEEKASMKSSFQLQSTFSVQIIRDPKIPPTKIPPSENSTQRKLG